MLKHIISSKWESSPIFRGENKTSLKPPPSLYLSNDFQLLNELTAKKNCLGWTTALHRCNLSRTRTRTIRSLGIQSPKLRMVMEPKYLVEEVIIHPQSSFDKVIGSLGYDFVRILIFTGSKARPENIRIVSMLGVTHPASTGLARHLPQEERQTSKWTAFDQWQWDRNVTCMCFFFGLMQKIMGEHHLMFQIFPVHFVVVSSYLN